MSRNSESGRSGSRRAAGTFTLAVLFCALAGLIAIAGAQNGDAPSSSELAESLLDNPIVDDEYWLTETLNLPGEGGVLWEEGANIRDTRDPPPMCIAHGLSRAGQGAYMSGSGAYMSGSVGGLVLGPIVVKGSGDVVPSFPAADFVAGTITSPFYEPADTDTLMQLLTPVMGNGDVVILVADDFAGNVFKVPEALFGLTEQYIDGLVDPNDSLSPETRRLRAVLAEHPVSHGALVLHHLNALIAATDEFYLDTFRSSDEVYYWVHMYGESTLVVQPVDLSSASEGGGDEGSPTSLIDTDEIVTALRSAVYEPALPQATAVIVNMSWVLLPCATVAEFLAVQDRFENMDAYLEALHNENPNTALGTGANTFEHDALQILSYVGEWDPLYRFIRHSWDIGSRVAFVAASGNFGMTYQMSPAAWYTVLGVGSPRAEPISDARPPPSYSNASEVSGPGAWFRLESFEGAPGDSDPEHVPLSYAGTSFSSPLVAFFHAVDAASDGNCLNIPPSTGGLAFSLLARSAVDVERPVRQRQSPSSGQCQVE